MVIDCCFCHRYFGCSPSIVSISRHGAAAAAVVADFSILFKGSFVRSPKFDVFASIHSIHWFTFAFLSTVWWYRMPCRYSTAVTSEWMNQWTNTECGKEKWAILFDATADRISDGVGVLVFCIFDTSFAWCLLSIHLRRIIDDIRYMRLRSEPPTQTNFHRRHPIFKPISWKSIPTTKQWKFNTGQSL